MNRTTVLLIAILVSVGSALAQQTDTVATKGKTETPPRQEMRQGQERAQHRQQQLEGFVDKNANGIDDRLEIGSKSQSGRGRDKFVDKDGDGICDERATGMGVRRGGAIGPAGEQAGAMDRKRKRGGG